MKKEIEDQFADAVGDLARAGENTRPLHKVRAAKLLYEVVAAEFDADDYGIVHLRVPGTNVLRHPVRRFLEG